MAFQSQKPQASDEEEEARVRKLKVLTPESQVKRDVIQILEALRIPAKRINSGSAKRGKTWVRFGFAGCPDIVCFFRDGRTGWIECKAKDGFDKMGDDQLEFQAMCKERGIPHVVAYSSFDVENWLVKEGVLKQ